MQEERMELCQRMAKVAMNQPFSGGVVAPVVSFRRELLSDLGSWKRIHGAELVDS
jgi:hypothetical protein